MCKVQTTQLGTQIFQPPTPTFIVSLKSNFFHNMLYKAKLDYKLFPGIHYIFNFLLCGNPTHFSRMQTRL